MKHRLIIIFVLTIHQKKQNIVVRFIDCLRTKMVIGNMTDARNGTNTRLISQMIIGKKN